MTEKLDTSHEAVKKTGKAFLIAGSFFAVLFFLSRSGWFQFNFAHGFESNTWKWVLGVGVAIFTLSHIAYPVMKPFHIGWMKLAYFLGWFNTRLLLGIFFYLIITPTGLLMRLFGKDFLDEKIDKSAKSYWIKRDLSKFDPKHAARTF